MQACQRIVTFLKEEATRKDAMCSTCRMPQRSNLAFRIHHLVLFGQEGPRGIEFHGCLETHRNWCWISRLLFRQLAVPDSRSHLIEQTNRVGHTFSKDRKCSQRSQCHGDMAPPSDNVGMNKPHIRREECFVEGAHTEIMVTYDWGSAKHCVQALYEPEELLWLVVRKDGKSDFHKHISFSAVIRR